MLQEENTGSARACDKPAPQDEMSNEAWSADNVHDSVIIIAQQVHIFVCSIGHKVIVPCSPTAEAGREAVLAQNGGNTAG